MSEALTKPFPTRIYCIPHGTLLNVIWQPGWEGFGGRRKDTCICMAESLCCWPKTTTTLLIGCVGGVGVGLSCSVVSDSLLPHRL